MLLIMLYLQSPHKKEVYQLPRGCLDKYTDAMLRRIGQVLVKAERGSPLRVSTALLDLPGTDRSTASGGGGGI